MKKLVSTIVIAVFAALPALAKEKKQVRNISSTEVAIKVCGVLEIDTEANKLITDTKSNKSYILVIDEVAKPKGLMRDLINYESKVYLKLEAGRNYCALGIIGAPTGSAQLSYLLQFSIVSE